jgi:hypothetical protein
MSAHPSKGIRFVPKRGHDKIGATAYANLDRKGTQQKIQRLGSCLEKGFRNGVVDDRRDTLAKFRARATIRRSRSGWESRRGIPTPVKR